MPEVIRGSRSHDSPYHSTGLSPAVSPAVSPTITSPTNQLNSVFSPDELQPISSASNSERNPDFRRVNFDAHDSEQSVTRPRLSEHHHRTSSSWRRNRRESIQRAEADAYYDSRAATKREFRRRATTLQDYYKENPKLLPQLPFTWHHGWRRFRLMMLIFIIFLDCCVLPIALYYGMHYGGNVEGWIIFAIVTTIWGGPTYLEFAVRTLRLVKKERFYRPLGTTSRWCLDMTNWTSVLAITAITALFVVGSAPHIVWLRVLSMPAPALMFVLGGILSTITLYNVCGWKAPFRISSTGKGELVKPAVYYFVEDVVAVNAGAGRPYREALAARYDASPRFRRMMFVQSLFWSIPPFIIAIPLTVIAVIHDVNPNVAYGVCWAVPFIWATIWGIISAVWGKRDLRRERLEWEADDGAVITNVKTSEEEST